MCPNAAKIVQFEEPGQHQQIRLTMLYKVQIQSFRHHFPYWQSTLEAQYNVASLASQIPYVISVVRYRGCNLNAKGTREARKCHILWRELRYTVGPYIEF